MERRSLWLDRRRLWAEIRQLVPIVFRELLRTRAMVAAAALAFYFLLAIIPMLIVLSALLSYLPIPNVFQQMLNMMATLVPPEGMSMVERILSSVLAPHKGGLLSFGVVSYLWAATGGFSALIEALDIAYDVRFCRPWWRDRLQALILTFSSGGLAAISLFALVSGPHFGHFLTLVFPIPAMFGHVWPAVRLVLTFVTFAAGLEIVYYLGPNTRQSFLRTIPGSIIAVAIWFIGSFSLDFYLDHLSNFNAAYGSLGAVIGLMLWFYITALAILIGAETNAELAKRLLNLAEPRMHGESFERSASQFASRLPSE
jgi:membrane protein